MDKVPALRTHTPRQNNTLFSTAALRQQQRLATLPAARGPEDHTMDVTATLSLGDPLEPARKATAEMLQTRERTYSLPQPFYSDERLFHIDMQEIFQKEWLIAGMTCEIPAKGNYITLQIGKNPIIVIRGAEGKVHAFHNVCRHRGSRLCVSDKGKVAKLVCHYHQWTYELDGRLLFAGTEMGADFDMKQYGLKPVNVKTAATSSSAWRKTRRPSMTSCRR
jgi:Rieske 2Fe-2S family protein